MEIPPKPFQSTAKTSFQAVGKGELVIDIPNGVKASQVRLTEVLYAPKVGYTLVSVGCLVRDQVHQLLGGLLMDAFD